MITPEKFVNSIIEGNTSILTKITNEEEMQHWLSALLYSAIAFGKACK